jgi:mannose-6-phosphate isomerase-like protein (cupin superfamily)
MSKQVVVRHMTEVEALDCPYGKTRRVVTGGEGGVANVHVIRVTKAGRHFHEGYAEVYYVLNGTAKLEVDCEQFDLRPGSVVVIPEGVPHSMECTSEDPIEFVVFGHPAMSPDDERFRPRRA